MKRYSMLAIWMKEMLLPSVHFLGVNGATSGNLGSQRAVGAFGASASGPKHKWGGGFGSKWK